MTEHRVPGAPRRGPRTVAAWGSRRLRAAGVLAAALALLVLGVAQGRSPSVHPSVDTLLPRLVATPVGPCSVWVSTQDLSPPAVLLYISVACPHCRRQLTEWERVIEEHGLPAPWLILAPGERPDSTIPALLRPRLLLDATGEVGRALQLHRVPLTVVVDRQLRVRERVEGWRSADHLLRSLAPLELPPVPLTVSECAP